MDFLRDHAVLPGVLTEDPVFRTGRSILRDTAHIHVHMLDRIRLMR